MLFFTRPHPELHYRADWGLPPQLCASLRNAHRSGATAPGSYCLPALCIAPERLTAR